MYLMLMSIKLQPSFNCLVQRVLLLHQQFSKIFVGHFVFGFFTVPLLLLFATLPLPGHHPREQGDMCLTLAGTAERDGGEGGKEKRREGGRDRGKGE